MGDLIGQAVEGTLYYVPLAEFERVKSITAVATRKVELLANLCRINALFMIANAGSGHIGSSFSSLDIMTWLLTEELRISDNPKDPSNEIFFSSKGHDAPGLYSALMACGKIPVEKIHELRKLNGLPGHPDIHTEWIQTNTGSLGMGISKAKGMLLANQIKQISARVVVLTGDGELQEGQYWESLVSAANHKLDQLIVIVDHNKLQSDTFVKNVSDLGDLEAKFVSFGWHTQRIDGHDLDALAKSFEQCQKVRGKPHIIIADTIKGKGVSFMEHTALDSDTDMYRFHSGAPDASSYTRAVQELIEKVNAQLGKLKSEKLLLEVKNRAPAATPASNLQKLIPAYSQALLAQAASNSHVIALDADLVLDTGLIPFRERFPKRFVECGIAEQDMVSQAGGMALKCLTPIVHSFSCFLSTRPNEQIYNNATECTHILYVGSLAGVIPAGPGHSHQAVRDIAALKGIPGMLMLEPSCEQEVAPALEYLLKQHYLAGYLRLCSVPWPVNFSLPDKYKLERGKGSVLRDGKDAVIFAYGPIMLSNAMLAAEALSQDGVNLKVVSLPWLNCVDNAWLANIVNGTKLIVTLDNHYLEGGQGETILSSLAESGLASGQKVLRLGLDRIPACGQPGEVLAFHKLDGFGIASQIHQKIKGL